MWLIVGQMPIKTGLRDASLALRDFSRSSKHCIHLSTIKTTYFNRSCSINKLFLKISQNFAKFKEHLFSQNTSNGSFWHLHQLIFPILILYVINWQRMFSFFLWWSKKLHFCVYFPQNDHFLHWDTNVTLYFQYFFHWIKV